jgi:putative tricarboxylic transport membrane protein
MQNKDTVNKGGDVWLGTVLIGTSILVLMFSTTIKSIGLGDNFDPGPKAFPISLSFILMIGGLIELVASRNKLSPKVSAESKTRTVLLLLSAFLVYVLLLPWLGFSTTTLIMATVMMILLGNSWKQSLGIAIILITIIYLMFVLLFKVPLPGGVFGMPF